MPVRPDILPKRYRDPEPIARGGMGEVYRAVDESLDRIVAVKLLAPGLAQDESVRGRFEREALAGAQLSGEPHVVTIFDVGEHRGRPFLVMEYLPGGSLEDVVAREGPPRAAQTLAWLEQVAGALDAAHAAGIVHRDVKPANLLLDASGEVHVADFGIASAAGHGSITLTGMVLGTVGYLAPEQARGERATDASDRYALAVVAFELLTGTRPFAGDTPAAEAAAHVHGSVPAASARRRDLPRRVDAVFRRGLAKDPAARYASCAELVAALREALSEAAGTTRVAPAATVPAPARRGAWAPAVLAALALAGIAGIAAAALLSGGDEPAVTTDAERPPQTGASGAELNDRGFALMQEGRYEEAMPLLQEAVEKLSGNGERVEAFALYNLAFTRLQLGQCDESIPELLDRSEEIQGERREIDEARAVYEEACVN